MLNLNEIGTLLGARDAALVAALMGGSAAPTVDVPTVAEAAHTPAPAATREPKAASSSKTEAAPKAKADKSPKAKDGVHTRTSARRALGISRADFRADKNGAKAKVYALVGQPRTTTAVTTQNTTPKPKAAQGVTDGDGNKVTANGKTPKMGTKRNPYTGKTAKATAAREAAKRQTAVWYVDTNGQTVKRLPAAQPKAAK